MKDYYAILRCSPEDDDSVIKRAWTFRRAQLNPRINARPPDPAATKEAQEVNEAWEVLGDPARRAAYDRTWKASHADAARTQADRGARANGEAQARADAAARARAEAEARARAEAEARRRAADQAEEAAPPTGGQSNARSNQGKLVAIGCLTLAAIVAAVVVLPTMGGGDDSKDSSGSQLASSGSPPASSSTQAASVVAPTKAPASPVATPTPTGSQINYGEQQSGTIPTGGKTKEWNFIASSGDVVSVRATPTTGDACRPKFSLLDPSGVRFESSTHDFLTGVDLINDKKLQYAGRYRILMDGDCTKDDLGYIITLSKQTAVDLALGQEYKFAFDYVTNSGKLRSYRDYRVTLSSGQMIQIVAETVGHNAGVEVYDPSGAEAFSDTANCYIKPTTNSFTTKFSGQYVIRVYQSGCGNSYSLVVR